MSSQNNRQPYFGVFNTILKPFYYTASFLGTSFILGAAFISSLFKRNQSNRTDNIQGSNSTPVMFDLIVTEFCKIFKKLPYSVSDFLLRPVLKTAARFAPGIIKKTLEDNYGLSIEDKYFQRISDVLINLDVDLYGIFIRFFSSNEFISIINEPDNPTQMNLLLDYLQSDPEVKASLSKILKYPEDDKYDCLLKIINDYLKETPIPEKNVSFIYGKAFLQSTLEKYPNMLHDIINNMKLTNLKYLVKIYSGQEKPRESEFVDLLDNLNLHKNSSKLTETLRTFFDHLIENEKNDEYSWLMKDILSIYEQDRGVFSIELQDLLNFIQDSYANCRKIFNSDLNELIETSPEHLKKHLINIDMRDINQLSDFINQLESYIQEPSQKNAEDVDKNVLTSFQKHMKDLRDSIFLFQALNQIIQGGAQLTSQEKKYFLSLMCKKAPKITSKYIVSKLLPKYTDDISPVVTNILQNSVVEGLIKYAVESSLVENYIDPFSENQLSIQGLTDYLKGVALSFISPAIPVAPALFALYSYEQNFGYYDSNEKGNYVYYSVDFTEIHSTISENNIERFQSCLEKKGFDINAKDINGDSLLHRVILDEDIPIADQSAGFKR